MKNISKKVILGSANLLALGVSTSDASLLTVKTATPNQTGANQTMGLGELRAIEAAHLEVFAGCKWGHHAFPPVEIDGEVLSPEVQSLHTQMG